MAKDGCTLITDKELQYLGWKKEVPAAVLLKGWLDGIPPREMVMTLSPLKSWVAWRMSRL